MVRSYDYYADEDEIMLAEFIIFISLILPSIYIVLAIRRQLRKLNKNVDLRVMYYDKMLKEEIKLLRD